MTILTVGPGQQFATLNAAVAASRDGDTLDVLAGTYVNDFATIHTKISIVGIGGMVSLVATQAPPNGKAILVTQTDVTLDHIEFSGAVVPDGNGAGIRYEGGHLTITNSYFHNNQDGILAAPVADGTISIDRSEFSQNGTGDGRTHNIYVNEIGTLQITNSYVHDAVEGHEIKSRAYTTIITNDRIFDNSGTASYSIDVTNGGATTIANNIIQQGPNSPNGGIISYAEETGTPYGNSSLAINQNTIVNERSGFALAVANLDAGIAAQIAGNSFYGLTSAQIVSGRNAQSGSVFLSSEPVLDMSHPWSQSTGSGSPGTVSTNVSGTTGQDFFVEGSISQVFNGAGGHDTLTFTGAVGAYAIVNAGGGVLTITDSVTHVVDQVANVEYLHFADAQMFVENGDNADVARLYSAALGRVPDAAGLSGWGAIYAANISAAIKTQGVFVALAETSASYHGNLSIAGGFTNSPEFQQRYGTVDNTAFVSLMYNNVLGRAPAASETNDWVHLMTAGDSIGQIYTKEMVLVGFAESPENIAKAGGWLLTV